MIAFKGIKTFSNRYGFTLFELLITISIIVLLASLLFPLLSHARSLALKTACASNLKQMGYSFNLYSLDFNGYLPHEDAGYEDPPFDSCWYDVLDPYIGNTSTSPSLKQCPSFKGDQNWHSYKMNSGLDNKITSGFRELTTIKEPSSTPLLFDGRTDVKPLRTQTRGREGSIAIPHIQGTNILFIDGHVKWYHQRELGIDDKKPTTHLIWEPP